MEEHQIEPELRRDPPRRVKRRGTRGGGTLFSQFFLLPIFALTIAMTLWTVHLAIVRGFGTVVASRIVDRYRTMDSDHERWLYYLRYRATIGGATSVQRELVDEDSYRITPVGTTVPLQISPLFPGFDSVLLIPGRGVWGIVWGLAFTSLIMLVGAGLMLWLIYILPIRRRKLVVYGTPVVGRLIDKRKSVGRMNYGAAQMTTVYFYYEYQPVNPESAFGTTAEGAALSGPMIGRQSVRESDFEQPQIGESYTILYDPKKPEFSVIYLYGDYRAVA